MIKIGVIGCGKIAQVRHIPEYAQNPFCEIAGYYNPTRSRAEKMTQLYGGAVYESIEAMLADDEIDAVSICTANITHADITIQALKAGKHVLCEKPMAMDIKSCSEMIKCAQESGKKLMIAHNQRFAPAHIEARKRIESGDIGKVLSFKSSFGHSGPENWSVCPGVKTWFFNENSAVIGAMADLGIHKIDLLQFIIRQKIVRTTARIYTLDKCGENGELITLDDNALCIFETDKGAVGTMTASWTYYGEEENSTVIYGTKGIMHIYDDVHAPLRIKYADGREERINLDAIQTNREQTNSGVIDAWIESIRLDTVPPITGEDVLHSMKVLFACEESSKQERTMNVQ